jgi:AcrR family transcriptional regulator
MRRTVALVREWYYDHFTMSEESKVALAEVEARPESSHDRILRTARELFATDGYENTTTAAIARHAGTSESQLIKHFGSKEGLLEAIFEAAWQGLGAGLAQIEAHASDPVGRLRAVSELLIGALEADRELRTVMLLEGRRIRRHGRMVLMTRGFLGLVGKVDALLEEMRRAGRLRPELGVEPVRSALIGAIEGLLRDQLLAERADYPARFGPAEVRAAFRAVFEGFLVPLDGDGVAT